MHTPVFTADPSGGTLLRDFLAVRRPVSFFPRGPVASRSPDSRMGNPHCHVYIVRCSDGSLFTGVAEDVEQALGALNGGEGSAYVRARTPVFLAYTEEYMNRDDAERRAESVRRMSRQGKESLLAVATTGVVPEWGFAV